MDKNEIYAKVNAKQQEIVDVWDQINFQGINFQKQLVENYEGMLKDPRLIEMDAKMDQAIKKVEDPAIFGLPEAAVNVLQERQKLSSQITGLYSDIAETQAKIIQKLGQVLNLQADIIDIFTAPDNEQ